MDKPWKVILAFVGVFIAGAVFGGLFTLRAAGKRLAREARPEVVVTPPPAEPKTVGAEKQPRPPAPGPAVAGAPQNTPPAPPRGIAPALMRQLTQRLSPTPSQTKEIRRIVGRASEDIQRYQRDHLQDVARATDRMYEDVSAILSPEQRIQLEKMRQEALDRVRKEQLKRGELQAKAGSANAVRRPEPVEGSNPPAKD